MTDSMGHRAEKRLSIESVILPFFGTREDDHEPFEYLLQDVSAGGVRIAIPDWVLRRERLDVGNRVNFHIPFMMEGNILNSGKVAWIDWDDDKTVQMAGAALDRSAVAVYPVQVSFDTQNIVIDLTQFETEEQLLALILKDALLLKRGVQIYLRHLSALFSRISGLGEEEYEYYRDAVITEAEDNAKASQQILEEQMEKPSMDQLDLEALRRACSPEIHLELFRPVMGVETSDIYLEAIKKLESRLYNNFNTVIMLYIRSILV